LRIGRRRGGIRRATLPMNVEHLIRSLRFAQARVVSQHIYYKVIGALLSTET
jgi:hypothetical protein